MIRQPRNRAAELIAALRQCPILEPVRWQHLARWRAELAARFDQSAVSTGPSENFNVKIKNTELRPRGYRTSTIAACCPTMPGLAKIAWDANQNPLPAPCGETKRW